MEVSLVKKYRVDKVLKSNLNEEELESEPEIDTNNRKDKKTQIEKEKEVEKKDIKDVEKDDLDDEEYDSVDRSEVAASAILNADASSGGTIKLIPFQKLSSIISIESLLKLFNINPDNVESGFQDKLEITIRSPLADFKEEKYIIRLMDAIGEIYIHRGDLDYTITKKSTGATTSLQQAVDQQINTEEPSEEENQEEESIDLSYLPELNFAFKKSVKDEFFNRILSSKNE